MKLALLCALLLATPLAAEPSRLPRYAFYGTLNAADLWSTEAALARGGVEASPFAAMQSRSGRVAVKALTTAGLAEIDRILTRRKKRKAVWGVRIGAFALHSFAVYHNSRVN